jgi:hypothetical protein
MSLELTEQFAGIILEDDTTVNILGDRLYNTRAPADPVTPYIVFSRVSGGTNRVQEGTYGEEARIQLVMYDTGTTNLDRLRDSLVALLDGYRGALGSLDIGSIFFENEIDGYEEASEFRFKAIDFTIKVNS